MFHHWRESLLFFGYACYHNTLLNSVQPAHKFISAAQSALRDIRHYKYLLCSQSAAYAHRQSVHPLKAPLREAEDMRDYYTTKEASDLTGASRQIIRTYTDRYKRYFSTDATPEAGHARQFTAADLVLIAFIHTRTTAQALTHEQVQEQLASGELERFEWQPERQQSAEQPQEQESSAGTMLVPYVQLRAAEMLLHDSQRREAEAQSETNALRERLERLQLELGEARGELMAYKAMQPKRPRWWLWLFGSTQGEQ